MRLLKEQDIPQILQLCKGNPLYYRHLHLQPEESGIRADMTALPPHKTAADKFFLGYFQKQTLAAVMDVIRGYPQADTVFLGFFMLSGVRGWVSLEDITILPLQNLPSKLSTYTVNGGSLYHQIKTEMDDDYYSSLISLGTAPAGLSEGAVYYSYDGHYFYAEDALAAMLDDYRSGSHASVPPSAQNL